MLYDIMCEDDLGRWVMDQVEADDPYQAAEVWHATLRERAAERGYRLQGDLHVAHCGCAYLVEFLDADPPIIEEGLYRPCPSHLADYVDTYDQYDQGLEKFYDMCEQWGPPESRGYWPVPHR